MSGSRFSRKITRVGVSLTLDSVRIQRTQRPDEEKELGRVPNFLKQISLLQLQHHLFIGLFLCCDQILWPCKHALLGSICFRPLGHVSARLGCSCMKWALRKVLNFPEKRDRHDFKAEKMTFQIRSSESRKSFCTHLVWSRSDDTWKVKEMPSNSCLVKADFD